MWNGKEAFVALPLMPRSSSASISGFHQIRTSRRSRYVCTPCARSLDSYREGMRFSTPSPNNFSKKKTSKPKQKQRVALVQAMVQMNVASHETCEFLVRKGRVRVSGVVVKSEKARVNKFTDRIAVNGTDYGSLEQVGYESDIEDDSDMDKGFLPRTQRDFRRDTLEGENRHKKYSRRVDGGFYARKKYQSGK